ncbi:hypothetical protein [Acinetobacter sp. HR7]|uniref:hypothetical protein n=1 Tax=Acinetobacter sp. HR7 TaxID=1509403 RepID=UPI001D0D1642|nr:hypothetical protein [Acinetobacter sp. HR7]
MLQMGKTIFRLCLAIIVFLVTLSLWLTCVTRIQEILQAENQKYQQGKSLTLISSPAEQVMLSNNQKPVNAVFIFNWEKADFIYPKH